MARSRRRVARRRAAGRGLRRLWPALLVAVALSALVVASVAEIGPTSAGYRRDVDRSYALLASSVAAAANPDGAELQSAVASAPALERPTFFSTLAGLERDSARESSAMDSLTPPAPAAPGAAGCPRAMAERARATTLAASALEGLVGGPDGVAPLLGPGAAEAELGHAGALLLEADADWSACRSALRRAPGRATVPVSRWVTVPALWQPPDLGTLTTEVALSPTLAAVHRLALAAATTDPAPASSGPFGAVVPPTVSLGVRVVVLDAGNVDEPSVTVTVRVVPLGGGRAPAPEHLKVALGVGGSVALHGAPLTVSAGSAYALTITATSPSGAAPVSDAFPLAIVPFPSSVVLATSGSPSASGTAVTFTASVSVAGTGAPPPAGTMAFLDDGAPLAGCADRPLSGGRASCTVALAQQGVHAITADYSGTAEVGGSVSATVNQTVGPPVGRSATTT